MNIRNCPIQLASTHRYKHMMEEEELTYDVRAEGGSKAGGKEGRKEGREAYMRLSYLCVRVYRLIVRFITSLKAKLPLSKARR